MTVKMKDGVRMVSARQEGVPAPLRGMRTMQCSWLFFVLLGRTAARSKERNEGAERKERQQIKESKQIPDIGQSVILPQGCIRFTLF